MSHKKVLNNKGPEMEPCGTPFVITSQELYVLGILVRCFLSEKYLCITISPNCYYKIVLSLFELAELK